MEHKRKWKIRVLVVLAVFVFGLAAGVGQKSMANAWTAAALTMGLMQSMHMRVGCGGCGTRCFFDCPRCGPHLAQAAKRVSGVVMARFREGYRHGYGTIVFYSQGSARRQALRIVAALKDDPTYQSCCTGIHWVLHGT